MMKIAIVFPGQGSQAVGMMDRYAAHPVVQETFVEASDVLGQNLWALVRDGPADVL
ncbi:MAG: malonyl CoA-acyl carrier protein transacylase, partial [Pseudomonadota bacterium]|nr:malonyl CoA-acyl carrier protein transacylase [Pseudomonadota bacterium]